MGDGEGFAQWFLKSKFDLMKHHTNHPAGVEARSRFDRAIRHGNRVLNVRLFVTVLLASGAIATAVSNVLLDRVAAYAASATVLLLVVRLALDRYVDLLATSATFLALEFTRA